MKSGLLVIDAQKIYTDPDSEMYCKNANKTVEKINILIQRFQRAGDPIIYIRHIHKADGSDLGRMFDYLGEPEEDFNYKENTQEVEYDDKIILPKVPVEIVKNRYSAFEGTDLQPNLSKQGIEKVVICGFMTNFCCDSTARQAHDMDFFVDFIVDATGTPGTDSLEQTQIRKIVAEFLAAGYARVLNTKKFLKES